MTASEAKERPHHARSRPPHPALRPFVKSIWAGDGSDPQPSSAREHVLPTGYMHLVVRLSPEPIVIWENGVQRSLGHAVIGGARSSYYVKDVSKPSESVGAQLGLGAASLLFGIPSDELAERHTALDAVWGSAATSLRDRLGATRSLDERLDLFEAFLRERLPRVRLVHPAVAEALDDVVERPIADIVARSGYSHRVFIELFRGAVGLTPKVFGRVARFQRAAELLAHARDVTIADVALIVGFADQAHLSREFAVIAGVSPAAYRALHLVERNHVPLCAVRKRAGGAG